MLSQASRHSRVNSIVLNALSIFILLLVTACDRGQPIDAEVGAGPSAWYDFKGTWIATGTRSTIHLQGDRRASISTFDGTLLLAGRSKPAAGFRAEALVFSDSLTGMVGRAVWTDERGDQAYSELCGERTTTTNKIVGTFTGGTGRYAGATGTYEFSWLFVLENEDGAVQGQSSGLQGRVRAGSLQATSVRSGVRP